jgi:uncharacterized membrane protein YqjE
MSASPDGLSGTLRRMADVTLATIRNRLELLAVEVEEEKCRLVQALVLGAIAVALAVVTLTLLSLLVVIVFWDHGRIPAVAILSGLFGSGAVIAACSFRRCLAKGPGFQSTLEELNKDRACLSPRE